jgi:murein DD-endopeptidase MepM/ murein hydrolase activator NlpD
MATISDQYLELNPDLNLMTPALIEQDDAAIDSEKIARMLDEPRDRRSLLKGIGKAGLIASSLVAGGKLTLNDAAAWSYNAGTYVTPIAFRCYPVTQWFGPDTYSHKTGQNAFAIDIGTPTGAPVYAPKDGVISFEGWEGVGGIVCRINHADGLQSVLAHLSRTVVDAGWRVRGSYTLIGYSGATGNVSGPHLHWALKVQGENRSINISGVPGVSRWNICP